MVGGLLAQELEGIARIDEGPTLRRQLFEFDGTDLRAVLGLLASTLRLLVVVELAFDAIDRAMKEIDGRPKQRVEMGLEPRVDAVADNVVAKAPFGVEAEAAGAEVCELGFIA